MSISGIGSYQTFANTVYSNQAQSTAAVESDGDADRSRVSAPTDAAGKGGLFTSAISQTLFQIGVTPAAANVATGAAPSNPQQQALNSFTQNLFGALQASGSTSPGSSVTGKAAPQPKRDANGNVVANDDDPNNASATAAAVQTGGNQTQPNATGGNLENRLQNLIQQLGSDGTSAGSDSGNQNFSSLQQSYQNLISTSGLNNTQISLTRFLQSLAQNLEDVPPTGSVISITA